MEQYSEEEEQGGKKLLVILLLLLLCLVSMFGAGYVVAEKIDGGGSGGEGYIRIEYEGTGPVFDYSDGKVVMFTSDKSGHYDEDAGKYVEISQVRAHAYGEHADVSENSVLLGSAHVVYEEEGATLKSVEVSVSTAGDVMDVALLSDVITKFTIGGTDVFMDGDGSYLDISDIEFDDGVYEKSYDVKVFFNKGILKSSDMPALEQALKNVTFTISFDAYGE